MSLIQIGRRPVSRSWLLATGMVPAVAIAAQSPAFDVPPGSLILAIVTIGHQAGATIVSGDPAVASVWVKGVQGRMSTATALRILLYGSGFVAVQSGPGTFVIRRSPRHTQPAEPVRNAQSIRLQTGPDIVVTATKSAQPLRTFAGTAHVIDLDRSGLRGQEMDGTEAVEAILPVVASTGLGPGRDKIFIRGIADSSFPGPTQATVGQYLGDVRLNYNAPDPDLPLYDVASVEVLEGPQATLYGAGSLGGIIRTVPRRPRTGGWDAALTASGSLAENGHAGYELAAVLNVPVVPDAALRIVGYTSSAPGIIDDTQRNLHAVDRLRTIGGRGIMSAQIGDGWVVDAMGVYQGIDHADARYAAGATGQLTRTSAIAQPATNSFGLGAVTIQKTHGSLHMIAVVSGIANNRTARYDLSRLSPGLSAFHESEGQIASAEARVSRSHDDGTGWLIGLHGVSSTDRSVDKIDTDRRLGQTTSIRTQILDTAVFGEGTFAIASHWTATLGARLAHAGVEGDGRIVSVSTPVPETQRVPVPGDGAVRVLPAAAIGWYPAPAITAYVRYQRGYRVGGPSLRVNESPDAAMPAFSAAAFRPDALDMVEAGLRFGQTRSSVLSGGLSASASRWRNIQADLFDTIGSYTANIGDGRILSLEATGRLRASKTLDISAALFAANARLSRSGLAASAGAGQRLPNVPGVTWRLEATKRIKLDDWQISTRASLRYVGSSHLGTGQYYGLRQGDYADLNLGVEIERSGRTAYITLTNVLGTQGNRFALGNPYTAAAGDQRTPLPQRSVRIETRVNF